MLLFRTRSGPRLQVDDRIFPVAADWDELINDDRLHARLDELARSQVPGTATVHPDELLAPVRRQEIWASGVTYFSSKLARQEESAAAGGGDFYERVYHADRPELFFKATSARCTGPGGRIRIRRDSTWNVPEPELTLVITSSGRIVGYTIGNDVSSRSIEGENPLYLPQAKTYDGCAAVGPGIWVSPDPPAPGTEIRLEVRRDGATVFAEATTLDRMKRRPAELVEYLFRECSFPHGCLLMTGTGIVPSPDFTLRSGDETHITIAPIGTLINYVA